jgi:hypothetical protein
VGFLTLFSYILFKEGNIKGKMKIIIYANFLIYLKILNRLINFNASFPSLNLMFFINSST